MGSPARFNDSHLHTWGRRGIQRWREVKVLKTKNHYALRNATQASHQLRFWNNLPPNLRQDGEKQLLMSTRQRRWRARRIRASPDALICCCSKHLKLPQSSWESGLTGYMDSTWQHVVTVSKWIEDLLETGESETQRTKALRRLDGIRNLQVRVCHYLYAEDEDVSPTLKVTLIKASVRKVSSLKQGFICKRFVTMLPFINIRRR